MQLIRKFHLNSILQFAKIVPTNLKGKSKSSQKWITRQLSDPYVERAKILNYRCRSAFKLLEINQKVGLLQPGQIVVDCGAAPGSWTQVAVAKTNSNSIDPNLPVGFVVGVDILQLHPVPGAHVIGNSDFTKSAVQDRIKTILNGRKVDCVLSDMAPNATGVRTLDQENIITLSYSVLRFAALMSNENANLLIKVWDNGEVKQLENDIQRFYEKIKIIKPDASRSDSSEKFIYASGFVGLNNTAG